jgi:hypothetical protein
MKPILTFMLAPALLCIFSACQTTRTGPPVDHEGELTMQANSQEPIVNPAISYSDQVYLDLVRKYTVDGGDKVDYAGWKESVEDLAALGKQVELIGQVSPDSHPELFPNRATQRSYWINTYNTLVLQAVLENWPLNTVRDVKISLSSRVVPGKGFFYDREVIVGGEKTNLYKLEKAVLKQQKDPRLHFALNCASNSCPVLRPWEWTDEQLDMAAREFVNNEQNVKVSGKQLTISSIFKWYKKDFPGDIIVYLQQYAEPELERQLQIASDDRYALKYAKYDWSLNDNQEDDESHDDA